MVQQEEPSEAINEHLLRTVNEDERVRETLDRHMLSGDIDLNMQNPSASEGEEGEDSEDTFKEEVAEDEYTRSSTKDPRAGRGNIASKGAGPS